MVNQARENRSWSSKEQLQNNKGSALVLVVAVMAIVGIFAVTLLSISFMNFQMKHVNKQAQENFYDAETVLDQIRTGLIVDVGESAAIAYENTLKKYSQLDEAERDALYKSTFAAELLTRIHATDVGGSYTYDTSYLLGKVDAAIRAENVSGNLVSTADAMGRCVLNVNITEGVFTIKNLKISFLNNKDFLTEILTDIELACPKIDYSKSTQIPDLMNYCIVADSKVSNNQPALGVAVRGSAYLGRHGASFDNFSVSFSPQIGMENATLICGDRVEVRNGSHMSVGAKVDLWSKELNVDSSVFSTSGSKLYLEDDLILTNSSRTSSTVNLSGDVHAYGNPDFANSASVYINQYDYAEAVRTRPADYSSAFIINGKDTTLNLAGVSNLTIAGNAYVGASLESEDNTDVLMGESIAIKSNQKAYMVPPEFVAAFCDNGGLNPMTNDTYNALCAELRDKLGYASTAEVGLKDFVRTDETDASMVQGLRDLGVEDVRREVYRVVKNDGSSINMVYLFMVFKDAKAAVQFSKDYFDTETNPEHLSQLQERMGEYGYNADIIEPSALNFYYNGSVLFDKNNTRVYAGKSLEATDDDRRTLRISQNKMQDHFAALGHKLLTDYSLLTYTERTRGVYNNLVKPMSGMVGTTVYEDIALNTAAVVTNGSYTLSSNVTSNGVPINLVIANGNVTVECSYNGLVIAGGTTTTVIPETGETIVSGGEVILSPRAGEPFSINADSSAVTRALGIIGADGSKPADFLYDGDRYLASGGLGGGGSISLVDTQIDFSDSVTYRNWKKR